VEQTLRGTWPEYHLSVTLPYEAGTKWPKDIREALQGWLVEKFDEIPVVKKPSDRFEFTIPGVPSPVQVAKWPSDRGGVFLGRFAPAGVPDPKALDDRMRQGLSHKYDQLDQVRQERGAQTVTLLENRDIALVNTLDFYRAFLRVTWKDPYRGLAQVWLAETWEGADERNTEFYCFRGQESLMTRANPEGFWFGPRYDSYWKEHLA
jgi:hypothetical protein